MPINIAIAGINGRMGQELVAAAQDDDGFIIVGGLHRGHCLDDLALFDVLIDFTNADSTVDLAQSCAARKVPFISGVTGLSSGQLQELNKIGSIIPVFYSRNFSLGIAALLKILPSLSSMLNGYDIEIIETHHRHKNDAPSGTAQALAEAIYGDSDRQPVYGRHGWSPRASGEIGIHSVRGGGNPGEHTILFMNEGEEIRIGHRALSRRTFALGALRATRFIIDQPPGLYGMADLLAV
jgi:4-hydroxy-tetrahydrodipicolinate reductase